MDLRGTHCNNLNKDLLKKAEISSKRFAQDWLEIAKKEGIKKVLIHGVSYGTSLSLYIVDLFEKNGIDVIGLIQEGTMGDYKQWPQLADFYSRVWNAHVGMFQKFYQNEFSLLSSNKKAFSYNREQLAKVAEIISLMGYVKLNSKNPPISLINFLYEFRRKN